jgi:hypothetical protein
MEQNEKEQLLEIVEISLNTAFFLINLLKSPKSTKFEV